MRASTGLLARIVSCVIDSASQQVTFTFEGAPLATATVPREWVLDNDSSLRHPTGQKVSNIFAKYRESGLPALVSAAVDPTGDVVRFSANNASEIRLRSRDVVAYLAEKPRLPRPQAVRHENILRASFDDFLIHAAGTSASTRNASGCSSLKS